MSTPEQRFWAKVDKSGECWVWTAARKSRGYGQFHFAGRTQGAHRVSWEIAAGQPAPAGIDVCHSCDNPPCVNPGHLFLGTRADNAADMVAKGRSSRTPRFWGERHPRARLTDEAVRQIRALRALGIQGLWVAHLFGVRPSTVAAVVHGQNWRATR